MPGWVGPTVALSLVLIALATVTVYGVMIVALRRAAAEARSLARRWRKSARSSRPPSTA